MFDLNIVDMFKPVIVFFLDLLKIPLYICAVFVGLLIFLTVLHLCYFLFVKKKKLKLREVPSTYKRRSIFMRIFYDFPRRVALDLINSDPNKFPEHGVIVFVGRQGNGKTSAMAHYMLTQQAKCPQVKVITNMAYKYQDATLDHWKRLIDFKNGKHGVIATIDEMQNWFSSNQSKNFPPEMLGVITQNRKNTRVVLGTAQNFYLLAKALRSQTTEVRECITILRCLTIVRRKEPILDMSGEVVKYKKRGIYFFVHSDKLRDCYDTYRVVESLKHSGFQERQPEQTVTVNVHTE